MSKLKFLVIHCTATPEGREVTSTDIKIWHTAPKPRGNGWKQVGYSDMIHLDGKLENLVPFDQDNNVDNWEVTNGAAGYNSASRHVVYVGGSAAHKDLALKYYPAKDTRTQAQSFALVTYVKYMVLRHPEIKVCGHNQLSNKSCPSFDVQKWACAIGIDPKNIL